MKAYKRLLFLFALLLLAFLCFNNVRKFQFINWQDQERIVHNEQINSLNFKSFSTFFTTFESEKYQPLVILSFAIDHAVYGGKNPLGFHLTSLLLHLINIVLLFILLRKLYFNDFQSFILVLLFAVHPYQVEAVSWVSARSTLLFSMFYLCALIFYANFAETRKTSFVIHAFVFFLLALFSNTAAASFLLFIPLLEWYSHPRINLRTWIRLVVFAMPLVFILILIYFLRIDPGPLYSMGEGDNGFLQNLGFAFWSVLLYAFHLVIPSAQNVFRVYPEFSVWMYVLPLLFIAGVVYTLVKFKNHRKILLISLGFFLIPLFVHLKIFQLSAQMMADRFMYLSVPGLFIIPVCIVSHFLKKYPRKLFQIIAVSVMIIVSSVYFVKSMKMTFTWQNSVSLWTNVIENNPEHPLGYFNRALAFRDKGMHIDAIADFDRVIELQPSNADAYLERGNVYSFVGSYDRAIDDFNAVFKLNRELYHTFFYRGNAHFNKEDFVNALKDYRSFTAYEPMHEQASFKTILCMMELGYSIEEIYNELDIFIIKFPDNSEGYYLRGLILMNGVPDDACKDFQKAAEMGNKAAKEIVLSLCM